MLASTLITNALRLINVPGRGGTLSAPDQADAFTVLQDMLNSESVSKLFVPGIRRHFFPMVASQHIYTYGEGRELDSLDFEDPAPIKIEDAYIRVGSIIQNNERVNSDRFDTDNGDWTKGAGWTIFNGAGQASNAAGTLVQVLSGLSIGTTYKVKLSITVAAGDVTITLDALTTEITSSGDYTFTFTATTATPTLTFTPDGTLNFTGAIDSVSVRDQDQRERTELVGFGSDYTIDIIDQKHYNRRFSKGTGGRPYQLLFARNYPDDEIRFDNAPGGPTDILVMDVLVNRVKVTKVFEELRMHDDAIKFLRYQLACEMAPEYGKQLAPSAVKELNYAKDRLIIGVLRWNALRVDQGLQSRRTFDINRGDP